MSVVKPNSASKLDKTSIISMHLDATESANFVTDENLGRDSIGPQHLSTAPELVGTAGANANHTFVHDFKEQTLTDVVRVNKLISAQSSSTGAGLNSSNNDLVNEVTTWHLISQTSASVPFEPTEDMSFAIIYSFDSSVAKIVDTSNDEPLNQGTNFGLAQGATAETVLFDEDGMVWFALVLTEQERTLPGGTFADTNICTYSDVAGTHIIDSNKFNFDHSGTGNTKPRYGGVQQSVSWFSQKEYNYSTSQGPKEYQLQAKLYAAYSKCAVAAVNEAVSDVNYWPQLAATTVRFTIFKLPRK